MAALGSPVRFEQLPPDLQALLARARQAGPDPSQGVLWFANGDEIALGGYDYLRKAAPPLVVFGAAGAGIASYYLFSDDHVAGGLALAALACVLFVAGVFVGTSTMSRTQNAVRRFDLGTWLLPNALVLVSHGRYVVLPRERMIRAGRYRWGDAGSDYYAYAFYRGEDGKEKPQKLTGFLRNDAAVAALERWASRAGGGA